MELKPLYSKEMIAEKIEQLSRRIAEDYPKDEPLVCVCVLKGAALFFTDLVRALQDRTIVLDFIALKSYMGDKSSGTVKLVQDITQPMDNRHVLIVEDIVDSGRTVQFLREYFSQKNVRSVRVAALIDKPIARTVKATPDYTAFTMENEAFVVGYGLDLDQLYRHLDGVYEIIG